MGRVTAVRRRTQLGAPCVVDVTQSLGAMPFELSSVPPDFLVATGSVAARPVQRAYLWVRLSTGLRMPLTELANRSSSENFARLTDYQDDFQPGARRFDVGQRTTSH